ncbi:MAG: hypothetical protein ABSA93_13385 [Streptosporangiaceae bacterium]
MNGEHARELRVGLERYVKAARKVTRSSGRPTHVRRASADEKNKGVRDRARDQGLRSTTAAASPPISSPSTRRRTASSSRLPPARAQRLQQASNMSPRLRKETT